MSLPNNYSDRCERLANLLRDGRDGFGFSASIDTAHYALEAGEIAGATVAALQAVAEAIDRLTDAVEGLR